MEAEDIEDKALRESAMQDASLILLAQCRAEEALELKTAELEHSLAMLRAALESTTDGILMTDQQGRVTESNANFAKLWRIPPEVIAASGADELQKLIAQQLRDPAGFWNRIRLIAEVASAETSDLLACTDGRSIELHSMTQRIDERTVGRVWSFRDITERRRAEEAVRQQQEWFRVTLSSIGDAVITTDTRSLVTYLNPVAETMTGWTADEARGQPLEQVFHIVNELTREPAENPVGRVLREGLIVGLANHTALISKAGTETAIADSAAPIRNEAGQIAGVVMVFHDEGERRKTQRALERSEKLLANFFENASVGLHWVGPDGKILRANPTELKLLGFTEEEYVGHHVSEFHADAPVIENILARLLRGDSVENYNVRLRRKDGAIRHVLISSNSLWEDGRFIHSRCFTRDVTDLKQTEEAKSHLAAVVESSDDAIVSKTLDGIILTWNAGAQRMFGYTAEEAVGKSVTLLIPPDRTNEEFSILERLKRGDRVDHFETVRRRKDGQLLDVSLSVSPIRDAQGAIIGASKIARDVTGRKQAEAALREAQARIHQAEREARAAAEQASLMKDDFLAALSHELRTPLTPALAILSDLSTQVGIPAPLQADLEIVRRNIELETRLIDDLLDLTRITQGKLELRLERVGVGQLIENAIATCQSDLKTRRLSLVREIHNPQTMLVVDGARITQVLWNLLKNAIKFTPDGGTITIGSQIVGKDGGGERVILGVRDTGRGIEPERLGHVFDAFEQGDRKITRQFGGLGLGLAISRAIAEAHHATLSVSSAGAGQGSTFRLELPLPASQEAEPEPSRPSRTSLDGATVPAETGAAPWHILLVEDHADTAKSFARLLRNRGYRVTIAGDVRSALALAAAHQFDVLLTDLGLPDATGYDLMRQIRELYPIPGIALSGYGMEEDTRRCREAGFSVHLIKPVRISQLEAALAAVLTRH